MKKISSVISLSFLVFFILLLVNPVNVYSESVESEQMVEAPWPPEVPNSKIWEYFSDNYYYNKTNLIKSSNIVSVWVYQIVTYDKMKEKIELVKEYDLDKSIKYEDYDHTVIFDEIDCKNRLWRQKELISYDHKGMVLDKFSYKNLDWISIPPESIIETLYKKVCVTQKKPVKKK